LLLRKGAKVKCVTCEITGATRNQWNLKHKIQFDTVELKTFLIQFLSVAIGSSIDTTGIDHLFVPVKASQRRVVAEQQSLTEFLLTQSLPASK